MLMNEYTVCAFYSSTLMRSTGYLCARDKTVIVWHLTREEGQYGFARRALRGHSHFVQVSDRQILTVPLSPHPRCCGYHQQP